MKNNILTSKNQALNLDDSKFRCPGCLGWSGEIHALCVWVREGKQTPITYPLCKSCAAKLKRGLAYAKQVTRNAEAYLSDQFEGEVSK